MDIHMIIFDLGFQYSKNCEGIPPAAYMRKKLDKMGLLPEYEKLVNVTLDNVSDCCPRCESSDYETSKRCNDCSSHFD